MNTVIYGEVVKADVVILNNKIKMKPLRDIVE